MRYGLVLIGVGPPSRAIKACPSDGLEPHSVVATTVMVSQGKPKNQFEDQGDMCSVELEVA